jgi:hypothetical protein
MAMDLYQIEKAIKEHMEEQPYSAKCDECGRELDVTATVDGDLDLRLVVPVCECQREDE